MANPTDDRTGDPGWGGARIAIFGLLLPFVAVGHQMHRRSDDVLLVLRLVFIYFAQTLALIGLVAIGLSVSSTITAGDIDPWVATAGVVFLGVAVHLVARAVSPALDCSSAQQLVNTYRTRFFLRLAISEVAAILGFVAFIVTGTLTPFLAGAAITSIGFAWAAPTTRQLERDQEELSWVGCSRPLVPVLRGSYRD
jgi:hypothetical protein